MIATPAGRNPERVYPVRMLPNVLLIVFDTARADAFEPYGAGEGAGPTVAQLARRGSAFPLAVAPSNWTMPSHVGMLTGALPRSIGLAGTPGGNPVNIRRSVQAQADRFLPEVLRGRGYATSAVSCNTWISRYTGFDLGFETFEDAHSERQARMRQAGLRARMAWAAEAVQARVDDGARAAEGHLNRWLAAGVKSPFFWFVNLIECHSPYMPPRPYNDLSVRQRFRVSSEARRHLTLHEFWRACLVGDEIPTDTLGRMRHLYGRSIRLMDDWLARVMEALDRAGVLDDTYVIVTSDHGENFGEGRLIGHSFSLDQRLTWVPLVVAGPDRISAGPVTSLTSVPRLIAEAAGLTQHPWMEDAVPPGLGVSQYDRSATREDPRVQEVIGDWGLSEDAIARLVEPATSVTDGRWKIVRFGERELIYDLRADPLELAPVRLNGGAGPDADVLRLRSMVEQAHHSGRETDALAADEGKGHVDSETAALEGRLRELGYL